MVPTLSYTNMSISVVLVLVHKCIVYQQIVEICCEVSVFPLVSYRNMHLPSVVCCGTQRALFTNKIIIRLVPNHQTLPIYKVLCMYVFELQELACRIVMYGLKMFLCGFLKKEMLITMPVFCVSPNSITSPSFICWSIPVSEIREFNRKKGKKKKKKMNYFAFDIFPTVQMDPF